MATFFGKSQKTLERLRNREYQNIKEKLELLVQLQEEEPEPCKCVWMLTGKDAKYREVGIEIVKKDNSQKMLDALLSEITRHPALGKKHIVPLLARLRPDGLYEYLKKTITSNEKEERMLCMEIVSQFKLQKRIEHYLFIFEEALGDPEEDIRYLAVCTLAPHTSEKKVFFLLLPFLQDSSEKIRHQAIAALARTDSPDLVQPFLDRLGSEPHEIQAILVKTLSRLAQDPDLKIEEKIIPVLADENEIAREAAAQLLAAMPHKRAVVGKFLLYTRGIAFWLRDRIFESMGKISESIADVLLDLLDDQDESIRIDAMFLAAYMNDQRIIPGVLSVLDSDMDWWVRLSAIEVLLKFRVPNLIHVFAKYHDDPDLKWAIISAYGDLQDMNALGFLKNCLKDDKQSIRRAGLRSLAKMMENNIEIVQLIENIVKHEKDWILRTEACQILENSGRPVPEKLKKMETDKAQVMAELKQMGIEMEEEEGLTEEPVHEPVHEPEEAQSSEPAQPSQKSTKPAIKIRVLDTARKENDNLAIALPENEEQLSKQQADLLKKLRKIQEKAPRISMSQDESKFRPEPTGLKRKITLNIPSMKKDREKGH